MTRSQLTYLYAFANLQYSEEPEVLAELKKIVLLELKAKPSIIIGGKEWNKNDILSFFDTPIDQSFDYKTFISDYPWVEKLNNPSEILYDKSIITIDFTDKRFKQFAKSESEQYENEFLRTLKQYLREKQDYYAVALLLYKHCFTRIFQLRLETEIKAMLTHRFNQIIELSKTSSQKQLINKQAIFFRRSGFYKLMKEVESDSELLKLNLYALSATINHSREWRQIKEIIENQMALPHDLGGFAFLNDLKQQIDKNYTAKTEMDWKSIIPIIFFAISLLILLARLARL